MLSPLNLKQWIEEHKEKLKPPVCNQQVYGTDEFIIMVVGGPNSRKDYHDDPGEEFFYQLTGDMVLRVIENGKPRDITIKEGDVFLLPAHIHHSPQRFENTVGLVIERKRNEEELDGFVWYCDKCHNRLHQEFIPLNSIVDDLPPLLGRFWSSEEKRTCKQCGTVMPVPAKSK